MARGDSISTVVPSVGDAETGASGDASSILQALKDIAETKVTTAELNIDATLDANTQSVDNVNDLELINRGSAPASTTHRMYKTGGEWYLDGIQVTTGTSTSLNVTPASGAIGGDYGTGDETFNYNSLADAYEALSDASPSKVYSGLDTGDIRLFEKAAVTNYVTIQSPGSLSASYDFILPTALPSDERFVTLDASGNVATVDSNTPFTSFKHGTTTRQITLQDPFVSSGSLSFVDGEINNSAAAVLMYDIPLEIGDRITAISLHMRAYSGTGNVELDYYEKSNLGVAPSLVDNTSLSAIGTSTITLASAFTKTATNHASIRIRTLSTHTVILNTLQITYDRP